MQLIRTSLYLTVAALVASCMLVDDAYAEQQQQYRLLLNSDGGSGALYAHEPPITEEQLCRVIDALEGTQVDVFIQSVSFGSYVAYDTKVGELYGKGQTEFEDPNFRRWADNVNGLLDLGKDPLDIWARRAHELGMEFWPALRMNDIHKDWTERWPSLRTKWELDRPHVKIGAESTDYYRRRWARKGQASDGFTWAFDYSLQEVRDHKFALIEELCLNHDIDGFELDFLSSPIYFKRNEEKKGMPLLTHFVRRVRTRMDEIGKEKGRKLTLLARVPPSFKMCELIGIDARTWIREEVVDLIAPVTRGYLDMNADVSRFVTAAKGTNVQVIGGLSDIKVRYYAGQASIDMLRAAAGGYWHEGATGIHLFNFDCHCSGAGRPGLPMFNDAEREVLNQIGDPQTLIGKNKHYYVTRDIEGHTPGESGEMQLPLDLLAGQKRRLQFTVSDDISVATRDQSLETAFLKVSWTGNSTAASQITFSVNGKTLKIADGPSPWVFHRAPIRQGKNQIELLGPKDDTDSTLRIEGVENVIVFKKTKPIDVGSAKQLFIDRRFIESSEGVELVMNPPRRDGVVLIKPDQPWEQGARISVYSSVLRENETTRIWYDLVKPTGDGPYDHERRVCYAESEDGLHFTKPELGVHEVDGSRANNVVIPGVIGGCAVWVDPNADPEHRYKSQAKVYPTGQFHIHSSPDGLNWRKFARIDPGPGGWDTQSIIFWDPKIKRYALFTRFWANRGDPELRFRTVRRLESDDLLKWDNQSIVMQADANDLATHETPTKQPPVDYYGADVFRYTEAADTYVMLAQPFWHWYRRDETDGLGPSSFDVRLAVSRDGKRFQRVGKRRPFLANGPDGKFDSRFVWAMPDPVRMGDELWIYYVGMNRDHDGILDPTASGKLLSGISRAVLRLDGFTSADAGYNGGTITTPTIRFQGQRLELNVQTSGGGSVLVEILDETGQSIRGFSKSDARSVVGNSVRMPVAWKSGTDVGSLAGRPIRLRFHMQDCKLYAFRFKP
ncbi:MAG: hypothetical protein CMJ64_07790 [Planctomycetaceae bacterium]|nr:hypothetical protein [Planctomycetaceae bacterium]